MTESILDKIPITSVESETSAIQAVEMPLTEPSNLVSIRTRTEPLQKLAVMLPVSQALLEDASAFEDYLNVRLRAWVDLEIRRFVLNRIQSEADVKLHRREKSALAEIEEMIWRVERASGLRPDCVLADPALLPVLMPQIFGVPVEFTPLLSAGEVVVGAFVAGTNVFKGKPSKVTQSNVEHFGHGLVTVIATQPVAAMPRKPSAFQKIQIIEWSPPYDPTMKIPWITYACRWIVNVVKFW